MSDYDRNGRIVVVLLNIGYHKNGVSCYVIKWKKKIEYLFIKMGQIIEKRIKN